MVCYVEAYVSIGSCDSIFLDIGVVDTLLPISISVYCSLQCPRFPDFSLLWRLCRFVILDLINRTDGTTLPVGRTHVSKLLGALFNSRVAPGER